MYVSKSPLFMASISCSVIFIISWRLTKIFFFEEIHLVFLVLSDLILFFCRLENLFFFFFKKLFKSSAGQTVKVGLLEAFSNFHPKKNTKKPWKAFSWILHRNFSKLLTKEVFSQSPYRKKPFPNLYRKKNTKKPSFQTKEAFLKPFQEFFTEISNQRSLFSEFLPKQLVCLGKPFSNFYPKKPSKKPFQEFYKQVPNQVFPNSYPRKSFF